MQMFWESAHGGADVVRVGVGQRTRQCDRVGCDAHELDAKQTGERKHALAVQKFKRRGFEPERFECITSLFRLLGMRWIRWAQDPQTTAFG